MTLHQIQEVDQFFLPSPSQSRAELRQETLKVLQERAGPEMDCVAALQEAPTTLQAALR